MKQSENWQEFLITHSPDVEKLTALFNEMDTDGSGKYMICYIFLLLLVAVLQMRCGQFYFVLC